MSLWTARDAASATGGEARGDWAASGVSIDSRTIRPGDLFVALSDIRDGNDFVAQALAKGAAAAMVSRIPEGVAGDAPLLVVADVLAGLTALGRAGRARFQGRLAAITGSVGKTSAKEMLRVALAGQGRVHAAFASYNNHWGVPLTLARMPADSDYAVIEIGMNHPGEIAPLARLARPHVALITTIAPAHLEAFASIDGIAREKAMIFKGLEPGGIAVVNGDQETTPRLLEGARAALAARVIRFGAGPGNDARLEHLALSGTATVVKAALAGGEVQLMRISSPGRHFALNALGVLATVEALGADVTLAARAMQDWRPPDGRGTCEEVVLDPVEDLRLTLIDDAFNANPASMEAGLEVLGAIAPAGGGGRRIAILGDMLELGEGEIQLHANLAGLAGIGQIDRIHCVGPRMRALWQRLEGPRQGEWCETADEMAARVHRLVGAGDVVLVKGSKGAQVSRVVDAIRKLGHRRGRGEKGAE